MDGTLWTNIFSAPIPRFNYFRFFLWGYLKQKVYANTLNHNIEDLKRAIIDAVNEITPEMLRNTYKEFRKRIERCFEAGGGYIE